MSIKPGDILIVKTTEEPVLVLAVNQKPSAVLRRFVKLDMETGEEVYETIELPKLSGTELLVRRPIVSEASGIAHLVDTFFVEELETMKERQERFMAELKLAQQSDTSTPIVIPIDDKYKN